MCIRHMDYNLDGKVFRSVSNTTNGEVGAEECVSTLRRLADGRLAFSEEWQWLSGDRSSGRSEIEEAG